MLARVEMIAARKGARERVTIDDTGPWAAERRGQGTARALRGRVGEEDLKAIVGSIARASAGQEAEDSGGAEIRAGSGFWFLRVYLAEELLLCRTGPTLPARDSPFRKADELLKAATGLPEGVFTD